MRQIVRRLILRPLSVGQIKVEYDQSRGIPVVNYGVRSGVHIGRQINPLHLAIYACKQLGLESVTGPLSVPRIKEIENPQYVQRAADWLISNEKRHGGFSVWEYDFPFPPMGVRPPWRSALAEAFGALVLLEVGKTEHARRHLESMMIDYRDGGVACIGGDHLWLLEYVSEKPPLVLNGMLYCLLVLRRCGVSLEDPAVWRTFEVGCRTLKSDLNLFDGEFYTFYDSRKNPADEKYHKLHVEQLQILYALTKDRDLLPWIARWKKYQKMYAVVEPIILLLHLIRSKGSLYTRAI